MCREVAFKTGKNTRAELLCSLHETESNGNMVSGRETPTDDEPKANEKLYTLPHTAVY